MTKANRFLGIFTVAIGAAIIVGCFLCDLGLMSKRGIPGAGFLPFWIAVGIIICGIAILTGSFKIINKEGEEGEREKGIFDKEELRNFSVVIGSSVGAIILAPYLGLITALGLAVGTMTRFFGIKNWITVILVAVGSAVVFYLIFKLFLGVPLPVGPLGF
ncbi:MAG: tripartite tricarboxylate transporter TctB family protein [Clostridia bacterium]